VFPVPRLALAAELPAKSRTLRRFLENTHPTLGSPSCTRPGLTGKKAEYNSAIPGAGIPAKPAKSATPRWD